MQQQQQQAVKIAFQDDIRRFALPNLTGAAIRAGVVTCYPQLALVPFAGVYTDKEGDRVVLSLTNDAELAQAVQACQHRILKLEIVVPNEQEEVKHGQQASAVTVDDKHAVKVARVKAKLQEKGERMVAKCQAKWQAKLARKMGKLEHKLTHKQRKHEGLAPAPVDPAIDAKLATLHAELLAQGHDVPVWKLARILQRCGGDCAAVQQRVHQRSLARAMGFGCGWKRGRWGAAAAASAGAPGPASAVAPSAAPSASLSSVEEAKQTPANEATHAPNAPTIPVDAGNDMGAKLAQLAALGFARPRRNVWLLRKLGGDVNAVVEHYLRRDEEAKVGGGRGHGCLHWARKHKHHGHKHHGHKHQGKKQDGTAVGPSTSDSSSASSSSSSSSSGTSSGSSSSGEKDTRKHGHKSHSHKKHSHKHGHKHGHKHWGWGGHADKHEHGKKHSHKHSKKGGSHKKHSSSSSSSSSSAPK